MRGLPGTEPNFHEARKYLTPMTHKGQRILAAIGSCKHTGCNYRSAWTSNEARDRGMWFHRAGEVQTARVAKFMEMGWDSDKVERMILETSDKHTVTYNLWRARVGHFIAEIAGGALSDFYDTDLRVKYDLGVGAKDMAETLIDADYELHH